MYNEKGVEITNPNDTAFLNPLRYRGYYYDEESGLYYLKSRYYNPEWGRFISADEIVSRTGESIHGYNTYSYCFNNPSLYKDPDGRFPWFVVIVLGVAGVAGAIWGATSDVDLAGTARAKQKKPKSELSTMDRIKNGIIGFSLGVATGGVFFTLVGASGTVFAGPTIWLGLLGGSSSQIFAIGALAFNFVAMLFLPIFGIEIDPIEYAP